MDSPGIPPESGGPASPDAEGLRSPPWKGMPWLAALFSLAAMWFTFFIAWPIGLLLAAPALFYLLRRRRRLGVGCLLLSPYLVLAALSLLLGIVSYFAGTAQLRSFGMPDREFANLDPRWRVYRSTSGCIVDGSEIFTQAPNNAVVKLLFRALGPMRGVYAGPYPSREEAAAYLKDAVAIPRAALQSGAVSVGGQPVALEAQTASELSRLFPSGELTAAVVGAGRELLLLTGRSERGEQNVALIDGRRGRRFAVYYNLQSALR